MKQQKSGITMGELLISISIVGLLAAITFPVLASGRDSDRTLLCLSRMQTVGVSLLIYSSDYDDTFPNISQGWGDVAKTGASIQEGWMWKNAIRPYVAKKGVFACPYNPAGPPTGPGAFPANDSSKWNNNAQGYALELDTTLPIGLAMNSGATTWC